MNFTIYFQSLQINNTIDSTYDGEGFMLTMLLICSSIFFSISVSAYDIIRKISSCIERDQQREVFLKTITPRSIQFAPIVVFLIFFILFFTAVISADFVACFSGLLSFFFFSTIGKMSFALCFKSTIKRFIYRQNLSEYRTLEKHNEMHKANEKLVALCNFEHLAFGLSFDEIKSVPGRTIPEAWRSHLAKKKAP